MNFIATIHRPTLTPEEREQRLEQIRQAAVRLVLAAENKEASNEKKIAEACDEYYARERSAAAK